MHTLVLCNQAPLALMDHLEQLGVLATLRDAHGRTPLDRLLEPRGPRAMFFPTSGAREHLHRLTVRSEQTVLGQAFHATDHEVPAPAVRSRL